MVVTREFRKLVTIDAARKIIKGLEIQPHIISVDLESANGKALAEDAISEVDVPSFDRASMDGYAIAASDSYRAREDAPVQLKLVGSITAGTNSDIIIDKGEAAEIATGSVMPAGSDAVVMVEYTSSYEDVVSIYRPVSINENIMPAGTDIMAGERILKKGTLLGSREIGVLAAIGRNKINVSGLRVGVISTGDELAAPGCPLDTGKIYDVNSFSVASAIKECGGTPVRYEIVRDDFQEIRKAMKKAAEDCDLIITSGSTSAGSGDMMYRIIEENGVIFAHGIDIKPGKPAIIGRIFGKPVFGLPGYPTSALTIFNEFIAPILRDITGWKEVNPKCMAKLAFRIRSEGRSQLLPVGLVRGWAYPIEKGSGAITTLSEADGFIKIPGNVEMIDAGEKIEVTMLGRPESIDLLFVGSHCLGLDALLDVMKLKMRIINAGSSGGMVAIRNGTADIAGVHLLSESGEYNTPFLAAFGIRNAAVVKGYLREQGIIVRKGSPIKNFEDLINNRIVNRNSGSGTRVLTDLRLKKIAADKGIDFNELTNSIKGYNTEAKTHSAVAAAVRLGKADGGIGIKSVAELNGLEFIKIAEEEYDFVIPRHLLGGKEIKEFLDALVSDEFRSRLPPGIRTYERTGEIL